MHRATADKNKRMNVKGNRTWLKIRARAKGGEACQWKCTVDINMEDNKEILMEVWSGG